MQTVFTQNDAGQWFWHTKASNGNIVADGAEGYNRIEGAIHGFLSSRGNAPSLSEIEAFKKSLVRHDRAGSVTAEYTHKHTEE
jgi:uncharacterized protein YegP (UPF0339 family)